VGRFLLIALVFLAPCVASADEPLHSRASCPEGSVLSAPPDGREVCAPQNCNDDADCGPGRVCRDRPLCVEAKMGGGAKSAVGTCESGGKCTYPAECEEASKRCVRAGLVERYRTSCGCAVPGMGQGGGLAWLAALGAAAVFANRRARRARRARGV
jgi:hypothetical protein